MGSGPNICSNAEGYVLIPSSSAVLASLGRLDGLESEPELAGGGGRH